MGEGKIKNIYETIDAVMSEIGAVGKTSRNTQQGFMFRGIDAVMNAINPALVKHHLFIVPEVLEQRREERTTSKGNTLIYSIVTVKYTFYAEDGSSVSAVVIGEGMDSGDKATNKAMSIAFKYACFQVFCIPTEEMVDPDQDSHEVRKKTSEEEKQEKIRKEKIQDVHVKALESKCENDGVAPGFICNLYKVKTFKDLTNEMFRNITDNWDKIMERSKG